MKKVTNGFEMFMQETNGVGQAFMGAVMKMAGESRLDKKTHELAYITALVTAGMTEGLPFHVASARQLGADMEEIKSAMLVPMPLIGLRVADALPFLKEEKK